tara:strand:+ start:1213 stop:2157 length:945 start_codon:yes stop_codon:yes gene_type:complete
MHRQLFAPPGAGKNFISYHVMWLEDKTNVFGYNETTNEYTVGSIKSNLFYTNTFGKMFDPSTSNNEWYKHRDLERYELIQELANPTLNMIKKDKFLRTCKQLKCSPQAMKVFENSYEWLPISDYSLWYTTVYNKGNTFMDRFLEQCLYSCTKIHKILNRDITSIAHYPLHQNLLRDIVTMSVSIKECEEWISDLFHVKQRQQPGGLNKRFYLVENIDPTTLRAGKTVCYRKMFFDNDENEIRRLYSFFGHRPYFENNQDRIMKAFRDYHAFNQRVIDEYDFSKVPGYEDDWDTFLGKQNLKSDWRKKQHAKKTF